MSRYTPRSSLGSMSVASPLKSRSQAGSSDYEEFASLQLDKPSDAELKTTEELKRHMFEDHFEGRPIDRAMHILTVAELSFIRLMPSTRNFETLCNGVANPFGRISVKQVPDYFTGVALRWKRLKDVKYCRKSNSGLLDALFRTENPESLYCCDIPSPSGF